jgi:hypothetical protein
VSGLQEDIKIQAEYGLKIPMQIAADLAEKFNALFNRSLSTHGMHAKLRWIRKRGSFQFARLVVSVFVCWPGCGDFFLTMAGISVVSCHLSW